MAKLYTNENLRVQVVDILREFGHDALTSKEAGNANRRVPDEKVLEFAVSNQRIVVTLNYRDFIRLHRLYPAHFGIIVCSEDNDDAALAHRIHAAFEAANGDLKGQLIRIIRPNPSLKG